MKQPFFKHRWGVFTHFLYGCPSGTSNDPVSDNDWNGRTDYLDVEKIASQLHQMGAQYYFITIMQGRKYLLAPNDTFDRIAGTLPGEACSKRDVIADLIKALKPYNIDLCLYYTGDGPYQDVEIGKKFGFIEPREKVTKEFVTRWANVLKEYSLRYGDSIKAWWIDGCYDRWEYNWELLDLYRQAVRAGNPDTVIAFNNGVKPYLENWGDGDYTAGEFNDFIYFPKENEIPGAKTQILAPLGVRNDDKPWGAWACHGVKRDRAYMKDYIQKVNQAGGMVTIDIHIGADGSFDKEQIDILTNL
ncbi:MAG: hypothetical protein E7399_02415 [Ruminococcaceae bacterium]|nr:hypothetical protein [Oscillospiraceae bacterium]